MSVALAVPPYRSAAWVEWRRGGVGASEMAVLVGCDPYKGEYALALEKRGETGPIEETAAMRWGARIERDALDEYTAMTGRELVRGETFGDARWPHLFASLDARHATLGIEVKATTRWVVPPRHVKVQAMAQMGLAGLDAVDVVRVSPYGEPLITTIERDDALIGDLLELGEGWYRRYVLGDELPPPDGSREAARYLDRFRGDEEAEASPEQATIVGALRQVRVRQDTLKSERDSLEAALKASMAGQGVLNGEGFRVTWSAVKGRVTTDWKLVAGAYRGLLADHEDDELDALVSLHTATGEGSTRLLVRWEEEDD